MFEVLISVYILIPVLIGVGLVHLDYSLKHPRCPKCNMRFPSVVPFRPYRSVNEMYWCSRCNTCVTFLEIWAHNLK